MRAAGAAAAAGLPKPVQRRRQGRAGEADRRSRRSSCATTSSSTATPKTQAIFDPLHKPRSRADEASATQLEKQIPTTLVFKERPTPRPAFILKRGEYDQRGEQVGRGHAGVPAAAAGRSRRATGSGWRSGCVAPEHPLTARVAVNRFWQQVFGTGLVKTAEDFGAQGEPPSHPELLDWLAVEFREDGWDVKRLDEADRHCRRRTGSRRR